MRGGQTGENSQDNNDMNMIH